MQDSERRYLNSANVLGNRIVYYERGSGPAVVLIYGMFGDHLDWEPLLEPLSEQFRVIAVDLLGFGDSDKPDCNYTTEFFLQTLRDLMQALGVGSATFVGNSFGGILAVQYALAYPDRVDNLVLVSSGGLFPQSQEQIRAVLERFTEERLTKLVPEVQELMLAPIFARQSSHRERYLAKQRLKLERMDMNAYGRSLARSAAVAWPEFLLDRLSEIRCRTLLMWGDKDPVFPLEVPRRAVRELRRGALVVLRDCGHIPQLDDPEAFLRGLLGFLGKSESKTAP